MFDRDEFESMRRESELNFMILKLDIFAKFGSILQKDEAIDE